ncbi:YusW family protein [Halobacillus salinus]|uniref:YusW family protein n=1 Tax=Halobacillus salinus TaxID=192814 RepID=UPI00159118EE|nr:YusW family protein [Halobacillus salinus]
MKIMKCCFLLVLLSILLLGCGRYQEAPLDQQLVTQTNYGENEEKEPDFNYEKFLLRVDYEKGLSYEVLFDQHQKIAQIHELKDQTVFGTDAFNQLSPHLMEMSFNEDTQEDQVIEDVLRTLGLKESYKRFMLDVQFANGLQKSYQR